MHANDNRIVSTGKRSIYKKLLYSYTLKESKLMKNCMKIIECNEVFIVIKNCLKIKHPPQVLRQLKFSLYCPKRKRCSRVFFSVQSDTKYTVRI